MSVIHAPRKPTLDARTIIFPVGVAISLLVIFLRLWYIQVVKASELAEKAAFFRNTSVTRLAPRGIIFDRNGTVLAGVQSRFVLTAVPYYVNKNHWVLTKIAKLLGIDEVKLQEKVDAARWKPYLPTTIYVGVPIEIATRIAEAGEDLPGIGIESQPMRYYPDSKSFSHVLGYVWVPNENDTKRMDGDGLKPAAYVGKLGVEYSFERELMGVPGSDHLEVDAKRRPTRVVGRDNPVPGDQLILSLDANLQKLALQSLSGQVGAVVAIDPRNGEILCLASNPSFDAGLFDNGISADDWDKLLNDPNRPLINRAVAGAYAPGSTFKLVTSLAAESVGKFDPNRTFYCPGYYKIGNRKIRCANHAPGLMTFRTAIEKSCNTFFGSYAVEIGEDAIRAEALECGFYSKSGVDIPGEQSGVIPTLAWVEKHRKPAKWYKGDTANTGIGQGDVTVTPLQMANLAALVATEGTQYKPHLVRQIKHADGQIVDVKPEISHQVTASQTLWTALRGAMTDVVESGTATRAKIPGIVWAGKTGSAEHSRDKTKKTHAWFVGFAPVDNPQIAICVLVEDAGHGGDVSAPIAGAIVKRYLAGGGSKALPNAATTASAPADSGALPSDR